MNETKRLPLKRIRAMISAMTNPMAKLAKRQRNGAR